MNYADTYGLKKMLKNIHTYEQEDPIFWKPSPLLIDLVETGRSFNDLNKN